MLAIGVFFLAASFLFLGMDRAVFGALAILPLMTIGTALAGGYEVRQLGKHASCAMSLVAGAVLFALMAMHPLTAGVPAIIVAIAFAIVALRRANWLYRLGHRTIAVFIAVAAMFFAGWAAAFAGYAPWRYDEGALNGVKQFTSYQLSFHRKNGRFDTLNADQIAEEWKQSFKSLMHRDETEMVRVAEIQPDYGRDHFVLRVKPRAHPFFPYSLFASSNVYRADESGAVRAERVHSDRWCSDSAPVIARVGDLHWYLAHETNDVESAMALLRNIEGDQAAIAASRAGNAETRTAAVRSAFKSKSDAALVAALRDPDSGVRRWAAFYAGLRREPKNAAALVVALSDRDDQVASAAAEALREIKDPHSADMLAPMVANKSLPERIRYQAAITLGAVGGASVVPLLVSDFKDSPPAIQKAILVGLGYTKSPEAVKPLLQASHWDDDEELRDTAAFALGQIGTPEAKARLRQMAASDPSFKVRETAKLHSE